MILIHPPVAKPGEPPAGIALLAGALADRGIPCRLLDANLEGLFFLLDRPRTAGDTWTRRAHANRARNIAALRDAAIYRSRDRYRRAVRDVNRVLSLSASGSGAVVGLADYQHATWSPLRSSDLIAAAERPELNPFYPYFRGRLPAALDKGSTGMVGISLNYLSQALSAFAMIGFIRRTFPGKRIILGGGLVTSWMKRPGWSDPFAGLVDHYVAGPGEGPLLELLGSPMGTIGHSTPDYSQLPIAEYLSPGFVLPYSGSSGCWWNRCSFCPETAEDNPYHPIPATQAMKDIASLTAASRPVLLHLLDNAVSPALMAALMDSPPGVPWYGFARIGRELADQDYCRKLRASGCVMLKLGLESGDQGVLDRMQKGIDLDTASQALINLRRAGIAAYVYLLFGTPEESEVEARRTLEFTVRHGSAISFLNLAVFNMPLCGSGARRGATGPFYDGDLSLYTGFDHPLGWDRKKVRQFLNSEFRQHPAVSAILRNDPPVFTSNHAAFFADL
ncbi:MAG: B12-binding domain-containing radical SAM protein [Nitrospirota bacterium]